MAAGEGYRMPPEGQPVTPFGARSAPQLKIGLSAFETWSNSLPCHTIRA
jgi:hypothetical protein